MQVSIYANIFQVSYYKQGAQQNVAHSTGNPLRLFFIATSELNAPL